MQLSLSQLFSLNEFATKPYFMPHLRKHIIESNSTIDAQTVVEKVFRPINLDLHQPSDTFDLKVELAIVQNMTFWRSASQSGYGVRYGCPNQYHFEIHFIEAGKFTFRANGEEIHASANSAVLLKDTKNVEVIASQGSSKIGIAVPFNRLTALLGSKHSSKAALLGNFLSQVGISVAGIEVILQIAMLLIGDIDQSHPFLEAPTGALLLRDALIMTFASFWPRREDSLAPTVALPRHLERAVDWLDQHAGEEFSIEQLARRSGASIRTLQNSFRQYLSTSPNAYIQQIRLNRVRHELLYGNESQTIEQIASRWGFSHMGYFAARYRGMFGESPSATRRERANDQ